MLLPAKIPFILIEFRTRAEEKDITGFDVTIQPPLETDALLQILEFAIKSIKADRGLD